MGQRMTDVPIVYGVNCPDRFDPGNTPKYLYCRFSGMVQCPDWPPVYYTTPPNDRPFKLTQVSGIPCRWEFLDVDWFIQFTFAIGPQNTLVFLINNNDGATYFGDNPSEWTEEGYVFHNDITVCNQIYGSRDGIAVVTWTPQATKLLESINLSKAYDLFMELRPLDNGKLVYKFCKLQDSTNIAILFEP